MRKNILGFLALLICSTMLAQTPQLMSYQAVIRNGSNQVLANVPVGMRISILQGSSSGTVVYSETQSVSTNPQGLATLSIGGGTAQIGSFAGINWANGPFFLKAETDPSGGSNYTVVAISQLLSVPYAQYAEKAYFANTALSAVSATTAGNGIPSGGSQGQLLTNCDGVAVWTNTGICPAKVTALNCGTATNSGTLYAGVAADGANSTLSYSGGNGGIYAAQGVPSTGVTGLMASLPAGTLAAGAGQLVYTISGTASGAGTASFALSLGGQACNLTRTVEPLPAAIGQLNCASATNTGTLTGGTAASGVSSSVPYTGGNGGVYNAQSVASTGVTGLTATLAAGTLANGSGSLTFTISGTAQDNGIANFVLNIGGQSCTLKRVVGGTISSLNCASAFNTGTLTSVAAANGVSSLIPYTGGNGGPYGAQSIPSTGVTGLTATISAGTFANGVGSLIYSITGTPSDAGTASFLLDIGGQSCTLNRYVDGYPSGTVHCGGTPTAIVNVTSPTGKIWMDRNLGASQVATSSTDAAAYGDLYQWGRRADGHQCRNSITTSTLSSTDQPAHGNFITVNGGNYDWRSPQNNNLWQGVSGVNNPCPSTYRIPTSAELNAERASWSSNSSSGAFASPLKMPLAFYRDFDGSLYGVGSDGSYWSSTVNGASAGYLNFLSGQANISIYSRAGGFSVRCLKD